MFDATVADGCPQFLSHDNFGNISSEFCICFSSFEHCLSILIQSREKNEFGCSILKSFDLCEIIAIEYDEIVKMMII